MKNWKPIIYWNDMTGAFSNMHGVVTVKTPTTTASSFIFIYGNKVFTDVNGCYKIFKDFLTIENLNLF